MNYQEEYYKNKCVEDKLKKSIVDGLFSVRLQRWKKSTNEDEKKKNALWYKQEFLRVKEMSELELWDYLRGNKAFERRHKKKIEFDVLLLKEGALSAYQQWFVLAEDNDFVEMRMEPIDDVSYSVSFTPPPSDRLIDEVRERLFNLDLNDRNIFVLNLLVEINSISDRFRHYELWIEKKKEGALQRYEFVKSKYAEFVKKLGSELLLFKCDVWELAHKNELTGILRAKDVKSRHPKFKFIEDPIDNDKERYSIDKLKPSISDWSKPILNREQSNVLFNILKTCNVINRDVQRQSLDMGVSLLTGYSEKQIHKGSNTPTNQILNDVNKITEIQNALQSVIEKLDEEKRSIG